MKIVHINAVYNMSSTGRNVLELHNALLEQGHESYVVYSQSNIVEGKNLFRMGNALDVKFHGLFSRITGKQGYFSYFSTKQLLRFLDKIKPDIVHLNNLHGNYINLPMLLKYLAEKDIATVLTLHDFWFLTGNCVHYELEKCNKWQTQCENCPNINNGNPSWFFDRSKVMHKDKIQLFGNIPHLAIIGVSQWVTNEIKKSPISRSATAKRIYNWIDFDVFYPRETEKLNVKKESSEKFNVLSVATMWSREKGLDDILALAKEKPNFDFVLLGNVPSAYQLSDNVKAVGVTSSIDELAEYYSAADVLLNLSPAETFGKVSAEALACGTPVVCYNTTASPELVSDNCGYVVEIGNISAVGKVLEKIKADGKEKYSQSCIQFAKLNFDKDKQIKEHISIYSQLVNERNFTIDDEPIVFVGGIYPEEKINEIKKSENITNVVSSDILQKNIIKGIEINSKKNVTIFNSYFLPDKFFKLKKVESYVWKNQNGNANYNLKYKRIRIYSLFSKCASLKKALSNWLKNHNIKGKTKMVVYPAYFPFLMALSDVKKKYDIEVCLVIADLPQYMGLQETKTLYQRISLKVTMYLFNKYLPVVDKFVLLTEQMNKFVNKENKPYVVMEGIASDLYEYKDLSKQQSPKIVLYSGAMQKKYGICNLLNATGLIKDSNVEFRFYGKGEAVELIKTYAQSDNRIKYMGCIDVNELHDEQQKSTILINPRQNNEEYTKYSFPSKNLEYMLSGRPTICYMLDGMPEEYKEYLIIPEDDSVEGLAKAISAVLSMTDEEQQAVGQKARNFVLNNKNSVVQTEKIVKLINEK